eukprot:SAG31_NODE_17703_length_660_cov_2.449198_1_plen_193_part_10
MPLGNYTVCPASGFCPPVQTPACYCGQCNYTGIAHHIRNISELAFDTLNRSYTLPPGKCNATGIDASTIFFKSEWPTSGQIFEVGKFLPPACGSGSTNGQYPSHILTCGAGVTCNPPNASDPKLAGNTCGINKTHPKAPTPDEITSAVQATINAAAAAGHDAVAYFPKGSYPLTSTIKVSGKNFYISGSGYQT